MRIPLLTMLLLAVLPGAPLSSQEMGMAMWQEMTLTEIGSFRPPPGLPDISSAEVVDCDGTPCLAADFGGGNQQGFVVIPVALDGQRAELYAEPHNLLQHIFEALKAQPGWGNKGVGGGPVQVGASRFVTICGKDWYMPQVNFDSHCWYDLATGEARGPYHIGRYSDELLDRNISGYITRIPQRYADRKLDAKGEPWCMGGFRKPGTGMQAYRNAKAGGPSLIAFPCGWPEVEPPGPIVETRPAFLLWHQTPFSTRSPEVTGNLRLPPDPDNPDDWPYNGAGVKPSDVAMGTVIAEDGSERTFVWLITRQGGRWYEYHSGTRELYECLNDPDQKSCDHVSPPTRIRFCSPNDLIPGTDRRCNPAYTRASAVWDGRGRDPLWNELGPAWDDRYLVDKCNLNKGFGAEFPSTLEGEGGGYNTEIWAWDADDFFQIELDAENIKDPANVPQPMFRHVLARRHCGGNGFIAYEEATQRLYVRYGADIRVLDVRVAGAAPKQDLTRP